MQAQALQQQEPRLPGPELQNFWCQPAAVEQLSEVESGQLLELGNSACFPLEGSAVRGRLLVRQCFMELGQILRDYSMDGVHTFIITGSPGDSLHHGSQGGVTKRFLIMKCRLQQSVTWRKSAASSRQMLPRGTAGGAAPPAWHSRIFDAAHQALLTTALNSCSLSELISSMASLSYTTSKVSDLVLHQTVDAGYLKALWCVHQTGCREGGSADTHNAGRLQCAIFPQYQGVCQVAQP